MIYITLKSIIITIFIIIELLFFILFKYEYKSLNDHFASRERCSLKEKIIYYIDGLEFFISLNFTFIFNFIYYMTNIMSTRNMIIIVIATTLSLVTLLLFFKFIFPCILFKKEWGMSLSEYVFSFILMIMALICILLYTGAFNHPNIFDNIKIVV